MHVHFTFGVCVLLAQPRMSSNESGEKSATLRNKSSGDLAVDNGRVKCSSCHHLILHKWNFSSQRKKLWFDLICVAFFLPSHTNCRHKKCRIIKEICSFKMRFHCFYPFFCSCFCFHLFFSSFAWKVLSSFFFVCATINNDALNLTLFLALIALKIAKTMPKKRKGVFSTVPYTIRRNDSIRTIINKQ